MEGYFAVWPIWNNIHILFISLFQHGDSRMMYSSPALMCIQWANWLPSNVPLTRPRWLQHSALSLQPMSSFISVKMVLKSQCVLLIIQHLHVLKPVGAVSVDVWKRKDTPSLMSTILCQSQQINQRNWDVTLTVWMLRILTKDQLVHQLPSVSILSYRRML